MDVMRFRVHLDPTGELADPPTADLRVLPVDRMKAERVSTDLLAPSQRGPNASTQHSETWLMLWLWCTAHRLQVFTGTWEVWQATVVDYSRLTTDGEPLEAGDTPDEESVDPTTSAAPTA